jgi:SWI/SNF-related matrix-associated actin-dependent regulator of chromatin subfamily B protein 1
MQMLMDKSDPVITPEMFAMTVVEDYSLPQSFHATITKAIQDQLSDFQAHMTAPVDVDKEKEKKEEAKKQDTAEPKQGSLSAEDVEWWAVWRQTAAERARIARGASPHKRRKVATLNEEPLDLDGFEFDEGTAQDDMRIVIKVGFNQLNTIPKSDTDALHSSMSLSGR